MQSGKPPAPNYSDLATASLRLQFGDGIRIGPGKIDLLEAILTTGSISGAGRKLGMSYRRAWLLVDEMNGQFARPVVVASTGGSHGGGAQVTDFGRGLIGTYRAIVARTTAIVRDEVGVLERKFSLEFPGAEEKEDA